MKTRQLLYTMLTRGRTENHVHVITDDLSDEREFELPGITEQLTATGTLERVLARDGAAVSATSTRELAAAPEARLQDAATRYADAVEYATHKLLGHEDGPLVPGPLPWLPDIPGDVAEHPRWGPYLVRTSSSRAQPYGRGRRPRRHDAPGLAQRLRRRPYPRIAHGHRRLARGPGHHARRTHYCRSRTGGRPRRRLPPGTHPHRQQPARQRRSRLGAAHSRVRRPRRREHTRASHASSTSSGGRAAIPNRC